MTTVERILQFYDNKMSTAFINKLNFILILVFTSFAIFTPADGLAIKKASLAILLILNCINIFSSSLKSKYSIIGFHIFIFFPLINLISILREGSVSITIASTYFSLMAALTIIIDKYRIDFEKIFLNLLRLMVITLLTFLCLDLSGILDIYDSSFLMYLHETGEAMIGKHETYWSTYIFFFKASPLLIFLLGYSIFNKKYIFALLTSIALIFTGTRANFFAAFIMIAIFIFINHKDKILRLPTLIIALIIALAILKPTYNFIHYMFESKALSRIDKLGDIMEILGVFRKHPLSIFFGTGFGVEGTYGLSHIISEVALLDLWRKIGLFGLSMFIYYVLKPVFAIWRRKEYRWAIFALVLYLAIAMTNPLLYSSTAYLAYIFVYYKYYELLY